MQLVPPYYQSIRFHVLSLLWIAITPLKSIRLTLEYFDEHGKFHAKDRDVLQGKIHRSARFDERNEDNKLNYTSIIFSNSNFLGSD